MRWKTGFVLVMLAVLLVGHTMLAQNDNIELIGTVEAINADGSIVVNGQTISITTAELNVALTVGRQVKVEGTLMADGLIVAREVNAPDADDLDDDEVEVSGVVESFDGATLVIGGLSIDMRGAEFNSPVVVGQRIRIHASFDADGNLVAREANNRFDDDDDDDGGIPAPAGIPEARPSDDDDDDDRQGEFEFRGLLQAVGDDFIVVAGQTIDITNAEIEGRLIVGRRVKVELVNRNGQLVAREVETQSDDDDDDDDDGTFVPGTGTWNVTYTIRRGDTLSSIAARTGTTVEELARMNNITDIRFIVVGTPILVPRMPASFDSGDSSSSSRRSSGSSDDGDSGTSSRRSTGSSDDDSDDDDDDGDSGASSRRSSGSSDDDD
jgi:LysM repeat protein